MAKIKGINKDQVERIVKNAESLKEHLFKENDGNDPFNYQECVKVGRAQAFVEHLIKQLTGERYL